VALLDGRVLLTGATGGLGQAIAEAFAARGARLVLSGRRREVLEPLARRLGGRAVTCDLADRAELDRLVAEAGEVDVLIANAALPASGMLTELEPSHIDRMLEVNLRAPIALARALVPGMIARRRGHVVLISSLSGKAASPASSIYSATKFGLRGFALGLRQDLHGHGVGVSAVFPGFIRDAGMFAEAGVRLPPGVGTRTSREVARAVLDAVERDRAEVDVAPLGLRLGAAFAGLAPATAAAISRRLGGERVALALAAAQRDRR
jgi:short-subunit dehydrogenase